MNETSRQKVGDFRTLLFREYYQHLPDEQREVLLQRKTKWQKRHTRNLAQLKTTIQNTANLCQAIMLKHTIDELLSVTGCEEKRTELEELQTQVLQDIDAIQNSKTTGRFFSGGFNLIDLIDKQ